MNSTYELLIEKENEFVENIQQDLLKAVDIVRVAYNCRLSLFEKNGLYFATCPFHFDNLVSFSISPEKQTFSCSSCGRTGNAIDLVSQIMYCSKFDACIKLAEMFNIDLDEDLKKYDLKLKKKSKERIDLCVRSGNSLLKGVGSVKDVVSTAKSQGICGLALCDDYSTNGYRDFLKECNSQGVRPYFGATLNIEGNRVIAIARNFHGVSNINNLISNASMNEDGSLENTYAQFVSFRYNLLSIVMINGDEDCRELTLRYDYLGVSNLSHSFDELDEKYYKNTIAVSDSYYCDNSDKLLYDALTNKVSEEYRRIKSSDELLRSYPRELVFDNPLKASENISPIVYGRGFVLNLPYSVEADEFCKKVIEKAEQKFETLNNKIVSRLDAECKGIVKSGFACIFDLYSKIADYLNENNEAFSLRGAGSNSLVAYVLGISNVNPLEWSLPVQAFLGFNLDKVPDFDLNVSPLYREKIIEFLQKLLGEENIINAGYASTFNAKQASELVNNFVSNGAGRFDYRDLEDAKVFRLTNTVCGFGNHPGGVFVKSSSMDFNCLTAYRKLEDNIIPSSINDFHQFHDCFLKIDILGHRDMLLEDVIRRREDITIPEYYYDEEEVLSLFSSDRALNKIKTILTSKNGLIGIPEYGTDFACSAIEIAKPKNAEDLVKLSGLLHGTDVWTDNAEDLLKQGFSLNDVIGNREDIYNTLTQKYNVPDKIAFVVMEDARKGRGIRKEFEEVLVAHDVPEWYLESLSKIRYCFPRGHSVSYTLIALKHCYIKIHYPKLFYEFVINAKYEVKNVERLLSLDDEQLKVFASYAGEVEELYQLMKTALLLIEIKERGYRIELLDNHIEIAKGE